MGLFNRPSVFQGETSHGFVSVIQNEGGNTGKGFIGWRHYESNFNTHSKLLVRQNEEAIFENGAEEWAVFPEGTEVELSTQNVAVIRNLREAMSGGQSYFPCRVYFVSTGDFNVMWGTTSTPISYHCPVLGLGTQMRGGGEYTMRIVDSALFARELLRDNETYTVEMMQDFLMGRVFKRIGGIIAQILEENKVISMEVVKMQEELADKCKEKLQEKVFSQYGISLKDFTIELFVDEEQRQMYEQNQRATMQAAQGEAAARVVSAQGKVAEMNAMGNAYTTIKGMEMLQTLAENPGAGGVASAGAGLGMGMAAGGAFANLANTVFGGAAQMQQAPQPQSFGGNNRFGTQGQGAQQTPPTEEDPVATLAKLKQMLDAGLIPQNVYDQKMTEVLSRM